MPDTDLLALLSQETALINAFLTSLDQETEALSQPEAHVVLEAAAQQKAAQAATLRALGQQRDALLVAMGLASGRAGLKAACERHPAVAKAWEVLTVHASIAAERNNANGVTIQAQMADVQERMNTLRGLQMKEAGIYDARGRAKGAATGRPLAAG